MGDLAAYLGLYVKGDAAHKVDELEKGFQRLSTRGEAHMGALSRSMGVAGRAVDGLANRYTALLSGAAGVGAVKFTGDLQERMNYMGITAGKSAEAMDALKKQVFAIAQAPDIRLDPAQLLDAVDAIVEKTGDLDFAMANLRNMGLAMRATKAEGKDVGAWAAQLSEKFNIKTPEGVLAAIDHSINAGKAGAMTFKDLSTQGERLAAAYGAMGRSGPQAAMEVDATIQMIRKGVGGSEQAATAFEAMMRTFGDAEKLKKLKAVGIRVMDPEDPKRMRSAVDLYKELITKSKGDVSKLSTIFDAEAMRAFNAGITEFKNTGGLKSIDEFMGVAADGVTTKADALRANSKNINASMIALTTAAKQFADTNLAGPVGELADAIGKLQPEQLQSTMTALKYGAIAVAGVIAVKKGFDAVRWTADTMRFVKGGRGGIAGAAAGGAGGIAGGAPIQVIVMNWPGGALGGAPVIGQGAGQAGAPATAAASAAAGSKGLLSRIASRGAGIASAIGRHAAPLVTVGLGAYDAIDSYLDGDKRSAIGAVGRTAGSLLGAMGGGALGSMALPGVGTLAGGLAGAQAGGMGGETIANRLYDWLAGEKERASEPTKVESTVALRLDLPPGVTARATNLSSSSGLDVDLGYTVLGP
ncbi:phage tail tape measure protein, TP901 family [Paramagnetospirillum caucaseum]|uniref:Phage tail tape measure protein, TP901 family n=1 Tax=Paramagnetospirillum caucaseum TaxID=1244869 RepID=M3AAC4_9PROT|nr:phage tail tape measure protein, TP901 family [Paramagnetospirillum caucaseum]EME69713.1 phage tail tape measure protein, TP901 family [Paramagnetospirillum caucaseum]